MPQSTSIGEQDALPTPGRNQRATVRYRCAPATTGKVVLDGTEGHEYQRAWLLDLSATGLGMLLSRPVPVGHALTIHLRSSDGQREYTLAAQVVHATAQAAGEWLLGCELAVRLSPDDLEALL